MNPYLIAVLAILIGNYLIRSTVEILNLSAIEFNLPREFKGYYDPETYRKSQKYLKENTSFNLIRDTVFLAIILIFILSGGFNFVDQLARRLNLNLVLTGLVFAGIIVLGFQILGIPFSIYRTFVIEEKYGFNKTTPKTFSSDLAKTWILIAIVGGIPLATIIWFFMNTGQWAWIWCWVGIIIFVIFLVFIYPVVIMPLFNKFTPLEQGELKNAVTDYANSQNFKLKGIFKIDGSRRSSKSNAFFTGFGKSRRIALFDTLIQKHSPEEIVSILAHEVGHYKRKHIIKRLFFSMLVKGLMLLLLSLFINNPGLFKAFKMEELSVYASLILFCFLYTPINFVLSIGANVISRKHEYEADRYAVTSYPKPEAFISALKRLTVNNLSNLTPHPLKVFLDYSHPPVLNRIKAIQKAK